MPRRRGEKKTMVCSVNRQQLFRMKCLFWYRIDVGLAMCGDGIVAKNFVIWFWCGFFALFVGRQNFILEIKAKQMKTNKNVANVGVIACVEREVIVHFAISQTRCTYTHTHPTSAGTSSSRDKPFAHRCANCRLLVQRYIRLGCRASSMSRESLSLLVDGSWQCDGGGGGGGIAAVTQNKLCFAFLFVFQRSRGKT